MRQATWPVAAGLAAVGLGLTVGLAALGSAPLWGGTADLPVASSTGPVAAASDARAVALLEAAATAGVHQAYEGRTYTAESGPGGTSASTVDVVHRPGVGTSVVVRTVGEVDDVAWIPDDGVGLPAASVRYGDAAAVSETELLVRNYRIVLAGTGVVAGRPTWVLQALRVDGSVAARFDVDRGTGLLLSRIVYGAEETRAVFLSIRFGTPDDQVPASAPTPVPEVDARTLGRLRLAGWVCRDELPGGFALFEVRRESYGGGSAIHLVYSDGLIALSLFEQAGHIDPSRLTGFSQGLVRGTTVWWRSGQPNQRVWQSGELVVTVMGDVPNGALDDVVSVIPGGRIDDGHRVTDRLRRGVHRVLAALRLTGT